MTIELHETYKIFGKYMYHINFPNEFILNELPNTGRECLNCVGDGNMKKGNAMWRNIIIGYCQNCAKIYEGKRGIGFIGHGIEVFGKGSSAKYLYLDYDIDFENLGDLSYNPEDTIENQQELLQDIIDEYEQLIDYSDNCSEEEQDFYYDEDDSFGVCLHIGCGKPSFPMGGLYCRKHDDDYDNCKKNLRKYSSTNK